MTLRKIFPFPSAGSSGPLTITGFFPGDPAQDYNPAPSGSSNMNVQVEVTGGVPPYSYVWSFVSGSGAVFNYNPNANPTLFTAIGNGAPVNSKIAVWEVEVTDAAMTQVDDQVTVEFYFGLEPP